MLENECNARLKGLPDERYVKLVFDVQPNQTKPKNIIDKHETMEKGLPKKTTSKRSKT